MPDTTSINQMDTKYLKFDKNMVFQIIEDPAQRLFDENQNKETYLKLKELIKCSYPFDLMSYKKNVLIDKD